LAALTSRKTTPDTTYFAKAHSRNIPSVRLFRSAGFELVSETDQFIELSLGAKDAWLKLDEINFSGIENELPAMP